MIYPPMQKPPIWSIDPGVIAYNCQKAGIPHPVLAMPMWEGAGTLVRDYSGRGNYGTFVNNPVWELEGVKCDLSDNSYITLADEADVLDSCSKISIFVDLNWIAGDEWGRIVDKGYTNGAYQIYQYSNSGEIGFYFHNITGLDVATGVALAGRHNWLCNYDGSKIEIYKDGVLVHTEAELSGDIIDHANPLYLMGSAADTTTGIIYNAIIFRNSALTGAQAKFLSDNPYFMYQIPEELYGYNFFA